MSLLASLGSGLAGACALTAIHEAARRAEPDAPRMDLLGMRALARAFDAAGVEVPPREQLHTLALAGDILSNSAYYALAGACGRDSSLLCGAALGAAAGVGAVALPGPLGLGADASARTPRRAALTVAWYTAGGLAAGLAYRLLTRRPRRRR